jgi:hypothetical protein
MSTINKTKFTAAIAIILLTVSAFALMLNVPVNAQVLNPQEGGGAPLKPGETPDVTYESIAYLSFRPDPVGVGQPLLVNFWLQPPIHVARYFKDAFLVTLTTPDGTELERGPFSSYYGDSTGWFEFTPNEVGTWQIQLDFLGAFFPPGNYTSQSAFRFGQVLDAPLGIYHTPDSDGPYTFEVQEELVGSWPPSPLPEYWERPIQGEHREWWAIAGGFPPQGARGWPGYGFPEDTNTYCQEYYNFVPYTEAPRSAHILWKKQRQFGGIFGGPLGAIGYSGRPGEPDLIYFGRAYDSLSRINEDGEIENVWTCYDLRTGETIFERTDVRTPDYINWVERTVQAVPGEEARKLGLTVEFLDISGGLLSAYDPWDGDLNYQFSISPLTSAVYYNTNPPFFLSVQNMGGGNYRLVNWTIGGDMAYPNLINRRVEVLSNITFPYSSVNVYDFESMIGVRTEGIMPSSTGVNYGSRIIAIDLLTGQELWQTETDTDSGLGDDFSGSTNR